MAVSSILLLKMTIKTVFRVRGMRTQHVWVVNGSFATTKFKKIHRADPVLGECIIFGTKMEIAYCLKQIFFFRKNNYVFGLSIAFLHMKIMQK